MLAMEVRLAGLLGGEDLALYFYIVENLLSGLAKSDSNTKNTTP